MDPTADLDKALGFVTKRIEEEATRSGEPLSDEQGFLLNHLPKYSALPQNYGADPESPIVLVPRDTAFERLCAVAKAAYQNDLRMNPASALDWDFAAAVSKTAPPPNGLAIKLVRLESPPTLVGPLASRCCCAAAHILLRGADAARDKPTVDATPMVRHRNRLHCHLGSSLLCFTTNRGMAVEANH